VLRGIFDWPDIVFVPKRVIKDQIQGEPENANTRAWRELMKSYRANAGSGLAGLRLKEDPEPEPGFREVLV